MGLYSRLMKEKRERGMEDIVPDPRGDYVADYAPWHYPHSNDNPHSVACPVKGCQAKASEKCWRNGARTGRGVHNDRFIAWQKAEKTKEEMKEETKEAGEPSWMVNGLRMTQTEILAVQCPHCGSREGVWCQGPKGGMLKSFHAKRQQRAYDYWKEVAE